MQFDLQVAPEIKLTLAQPITVVKFKICLSVPKKGAGAQWVLGFVVGHGDAWKSLGLVSFIIVST